MKKKEFRVGETVWWNDPDGGACSGWCIIDALFLAPAPSVKVEMLHMHHVEDPDSVVEAYPNEVVDGIPPKRETYRTMVFSTSHITKEDQHLLGTMGRTSSPFVDDLPYSWRVHISPDTWKEEHREDLQERGFSKAFLRAMDIAHEEGCLFAEFDRDGQVYEDLERFNR